VTARTTQAGNLSVTPLEDRAEYLPDLAFHASLSLPAGSDSLSLTVGGVCIQLSGLTPRQRSTLEERYGVFCGERGCDPVMKVEVTRVPRPAFLQMTGKLEYYRVETRWEGEALLACSYEWAGWLDRSRGRGGLALAQVTETDPGAFDRSVENFLRVAYAHAVIPSGGFLLHSAGLVRDARAWLFFGPSGSGKTTVTSLTPEALVLSDDLTMVLRSSEGGYRACSVPFRGLFAPRPESDQSWPVAGFFRLIQDRVNRIEEARGARAVGDLVGSLPFVTERSEIAGDVIDAVAAAVSRVPVFRLHFRKENTFWRLVETACPGASILPPVDGFRVGGGR
jgi:hypothetical protein